MKNENGDMCCSECGGTDLDYYCVFDFVKCRNKDCEHGEYINFYVQEVKSFAEGPQSTEPPSP